MAPEVLYLLKVNIAIAVFYAFYRLFFHKDTFFQLRRIVLLCFLALSLVYPLMNIQDWIKSQEPIVAMTDIYASVILPEVEITTAELTAVSWHKIILTTIKYAYLGVGLYLLIRIIFQLYILIKLAARTRTRVIGDTRVHILTEKDPPFSFFKWIFINPDMHNRDELSEILIHEKTHSRQWHSIDVMLSELICTVCWFNPFIWLLKREIRGNLEYLADHKVLEKGYDSKTYQYHLLGLTHQTKVATLYNNFNVLPLKNRIRMMNKKRTRQIGTTKYLLFPLVAAALLILSNIDAIARTAETVISEMAANALSEEPLRIETIDMTNDVDQEDPVFEVVETMPNFPGGQAALMQYLAKNIKYPAEAIRKGEQGRVTITFIVSKDGTIREPVIKRSVSKELDAEAIRVISTMPKWIPGEQRGQKVAVKFTVPVTFNLGLDDKTDANEKSNSLAPDVIFEIVEDMPDFPGGQGALMKFLAENINYPAEAKTDNIQGKVIVQFVVDKDGTIKNPLIVRSDSPLLNDEALRVIKSMPKWTPGKQRGVDVATKFTVPVLFRLN